MAERVVKPKEIIFREGDPGDNAYVIQSGRVEILKHAPHGEIQLAVLEKGAVFGEISLFDASENRTATARAMEDGVLEMLTGDEFQMLLARCPGELIPFLYNLVDRLKNLNRRIAQLERASVSLDVAFESVTLSPDGAALEGAFEPVKVMVANLPYTIGGYQKGTELQKHNDLDLPCDGPPLIISQKHCRLEKHADGVYVVDVGSRFCSIVNGQPIGRAKVSFKAPLVPGENTVTLGGEDSGYRVKLTCS